MESQEVRVDGGDGGTHGSRPTGCSSHTGRAADKKRDGLRAVSFFAFESGSYMALMMSTISAPMRFCASLVAAPMWGVQDTMG